MKFYLIVSKRLITIRLENFIIMVLRIEVQNLLTIKHLQIQLTKKHIQLKKKKRKLLSGKKYLLLKKKTINLLKKARIFIQMLRYQFLRQ
mgnify:CR=1 FL=1